MNGGKDLHTVPLEQEFFSNVSRDSPDLGIFPS